MNLKRSGYYVVLLVIFGFLLRNIFRNSISQIPIHWRVSSWDFSLVIFFGIFVYLVNSLSWHLVTRSLGLNVRYLENLRIWMMSNASRLIPGAIWQYAGRIYLAGQAGIPKRLASAGLFLEIIFSLTAGGLLVFLLIDPTIFHLPNYFDWLKYLGLLAIGLMLILLRSSKIINAIAKQIQRLTGKKFNLKSLNLSYSWIGWLWLSFTTQFLVDGAVLFFLSRLVYDLPLGLYLTFVGIFALAWLAGYISVFAPGGLGVQELTMAGLLSFLMPLELASLIAIVFRLVLFISELSLLSLVLLANNGLLTGFVRRFYNRT